MVCARHSGFCLETQHFPSPVLRPGAIYRSRTVYAFDVAG